MFSLALGLATAGVALAQPSFVMPDESAPHEGTWLQWPHPYQYGPLYRNRIEQTWIDMTAALVGGENVHIIADNAGHRSRIESKLTGAGVSLANVDFLIRRTNDVWVRDNGPIFVEDELGVLTVADFGFDGWGDDAPWAEDDGVPRTVANRRGFPRLDLGRGVLEGGAVEVDGRGTLLATRSSILDPARNPGVLESQVDAVLAQVLGATNVIWLDGAFGGSVEITDMHIDGFARFADPYTIVTMSEASLLYWGLSAADVATLNAATDVDGNPYAFVELPLTANDVVTTYGYDMGFKGSYVNFYTGNSVVLMPTYNDPNDAVAQAILAAHYPGRTVVGIDVRNLYRWGGMVHCVTQQQPAL